MKRQANVYPKETLSLIYLILRPIHSEHSKSPINQWA